MTKQQKKYTRDAWTAAEIDVHKNDEKRYLLFILFIFIFIIYTAA